MSRLATLFSVLEFPTDPELVSKMETDLSATRSEIDTEGERAFRCLGCLETCRECSPRLTGRWKSGAWEVVSR